MSEIFDIFVRSYEDDLPVATLTIGLDLNSASNAGDGAAGGAEAAESASIRSGSQSNDPDIQSQIRKSELKSANETMIFDIKEMIYRRALPDFQIIPERQSIYYQGVELELDHKTLADHDIKPGATIHMRDQGNMIPRRIGKVLTYSGPLFIWYCFSDKHQEVYQFIMGKEYLDDHFEILFDYQEGQTQSIACYFIAAHFLKCIFETIFVHRNTGRMMPLNRVMWQVLYYWVALGAVAYTLYDPEYQPSTFFASLSQELKNLYVCLVVGLFVVAEVMNFMCHLHYEDMESRLANEYNRQGQANEDDLMSRARRSYMVQSISSFVILKDWGYKYVTCADYMWDALAWLSISLLIQTATSYCFLLVFLVWRNSKARERHNRYTCEYRYAYPTARRAFIPFLI